MSSSKSVRVGISGVEAVVETGTSFYDVIEQNCPQKKHEDGPVVAVLCNGSLLSLYDKVKTNSMCVPIHIRSSIGFDIFRRSISLALAAVCYNLFPERKLEVVISCNKGVTYCLSGQRISDEEWNKVVLLLRQITNPEEGKDLSIKPREVYIEEARSYFKETGRKEVSDLIYQKQSTLYRSNKVKVSEIDISSIPGVNSERAVYSTLFIDPMIARFSKEDSNYLNKYQILREREHGIYGDMFSNYFIIELPDNKFDLENGVGQDQNEKEHEDCEHDTLHDRFYNIIPSHLHESLLKYYKMSGPYSNKYISELNAATYKINQANVEFAVGKMDNGAYKLPNADYPNEDPCDKSFSMAHYTELFIRQQLADICSLVTEKTHLILICGPSSSGKTTFSHRLAEVLSMHSKYPKIPVVLGMDMYYKNANDCPILKEITLEDGTKKIMRDFEHPNALKIELINRHLKELTEGKEIHMPFFDFATGISHEGEGRKVKLTGIHGPVESTSGDLSSRRYPLPPSGCIIMEGIHGLNPAFSSSVPDDQKLLIFIHPHTLVKIDPITPFRSTYDRLIRRSVRDARSRGYSISTTVSRWPSVRDGELAYIFKHSKNGNYIFNSIHEEELPALAGVYDAAVDSEADSKYEDDAELGSITASLSASMSFITRMSTTAMKNEIPSDSILREFIGGLIFGEPH